MKTIQLKKVPAVIFGEEKELDYKFLLQAIVENPEKPEQLANVAEMRKSIRLLDALEQATDETLVLEDADYEYLKQRVNSARFTSNNRAFVDFVDHINEPNE